jgi:phosphoenolpyruvate carboxylase
MERREASNPAVRAEPTGIGSSRAPDPLSREVKLLGSLLGQVIAEQAGEDLLQLVERVRRQTIDIRATGSARGQKELRDTLESLSVGQLEDLIKAFSLYFHLTNLAEEKHRVRRLRKRARAASASGQEGSVQEAVRRLLREDDPERNEQLMAELSIGLVITAHPTEARRRTTLVALRRVFGLLDRLDDPRITPDEDAEIRRRLREEISLLWRTSALRMERPSPLDEVRNVLLFFDESLFVVTPRLYRALDHALDRAPWVLAEHGPEARGGVVGPASDTGRAGTRPPAVRAFMRWGSWVGADRDGHPRVTAETTRQAASIGANHVLHGLEAVATRLMHTVAPTHPNDIIEPRLAARLERDRWDLGEVYEELTRHFPNEPYRRRLGAMAERIRRTRYRLVDGAIVGGGYDSPAELLAEVVELQDSLIADGIERVAFGEVQGLRWQVETFGFHAFSLEVRQHSDVHRATLATLAGGADPATTMVADGVSAAEVLATFGAIAEIQARFGPAACQRYVISFTHSPSDVTDVLALARHGGLDGSLLDVVPLLESADALQTADSLLDRLLSDAKYRAHVRARGEHQEVMLGYSDSTKESGALAAAWLLHGAEAQLARVAERHGVRLTLFHGRGGAIGRGGGPMNRAILASAPHSLGGHIKITEQGEVVADRYANPDVALRHLEQLTNAVLMASSRSHEEQVLSAQQGANSVIDDLAERSARAYRALVWEDPAFEAFYVAATPIAELSELTLGSRPAARGGGGVSLPTLRAIPWVFSWAQSRGFLPAWFGLGTAVEGYVAEHGDAATEQLQRLYRETPFFSGVIDVVEMALAKVDLSVAQRYAGLASGPDGERIWSTIQAEYERTVAAVLRINGRAELLAASPVLRRSIQLRNPYVDSLSEIQVMLLGRLRALDEADPERAHLRRLVQLTVSGVAAGLQNTG